MKEGKDGWREREKERGRERRERVWEGNESEIYIHIHIHIYFISNRKVNKDITFDFTHIERKGGERQECEIDRVRGGKRGEREMNKEN